MALNTYDTATDVNGKVILESLWAASSFKPNDQQEAAIRHTDGPLFITAGPGSGKTRVLLWRALNLIVFHEVKPAEIFLSTFTEKAAFQLKEGLRGLLSIVTNRTGVPYDLAPMYIGTVHSLCRRILNDRQKFPTENPKHKAPILMDELDQFFHVHRSSVWEKLTSLLELKEDEDSNSHLNIIFGLKSLSKFKAINNCIAFFNRVAEEYINPADALNYLNSLDPQLDAFLDEHEIERKHLIEAFTLYETYRSSLGGNDPARKTDFSHLQQEAFNLMDDAKEPGKVFKHIIIDEYQDTNPIQEKIFFKLAESWQNICVVGDDDQSLYRFRGATVENFVDFPQRCMAHFGIEPTRITLATNYRSREKIVEFYGHYIHSFNWKKSNQPGYYRVADKDILAFRKDGANSVYSSKPDLPDAACAEVAEVVRKLIDEKKVEDPNQIAFLYPSLKPNVVLIMKAALENVGLKVYAPRAGRFLDVDESFDVFGLFALIFGLPELDFAFTNETREFHEWLHQIRDNGRFLCKHDPLLNQYITDKKLEIERIVSDYQTMKDVARREGWHMAIPYAIERMKRKLYNAAGLSEEAKKIIGSEYLDRIVRRRIEEGRPFSLYYIITRSTSLDWSVLDLFYRLCGFQHFMDMFDLAETGTDEGPICNLGLITQYLARFMDEFVPLLKAELFEDGLFQRICYLSFLFSIFRLNESEYEDAEDPFPLGRIPFLTIHQSKGLEFPVVVLGNLRKRRWPPNFVETSLRPFSGRSESEPLDRIPEYDEARMFYVALSRAQNLLILANFRGVGHYINQPFRTLLDDQFPCLESLDLSTVPSFEEQPSDLPRMYSYTSDFLMYKKCPRQYMIFRKYGFVPSRAQTAFFGSLVHKTLEDLHRELIRRKKVAA